MKQMVMMMALMGWLIVDGGLLMGQEGGANAAKTNASAQLEKMHQAVTNMVAKTQAAALERAAWRESNRVALGTNWQEILFGTNQVAAALAAKIPPPVRLEINTNFLARHPH